MHIPTWLKIAVALLISGAWLFARQGGQPAQTSPLAPPPEAQSEAFTISARSPLTATGVSPADILGAGGAPLVSCESLGLLCSDYASGRQDAILGLSFGDDFSDDSLPPVQFSVAPGSQGLPGTAVNGEAACRPSEAQADVFASPLDGTNVQVLDGDGKACASSAGLGLGLDESAGNNLSGLASDPCRTFDPDCDGLPDAPAFLSLAAGSPTLAALGALPSDILSTGNAFTPHVWASQDALGLLAGDVIDALCVQENGDGVYGAGDFVLFSLAAGSPSLARFGASPADVLSAHPRQVYVRGAWLGLASTDQVDGLLCGLVSAPRRLFAPLVNNR